VLGTLLGPEGSGFGLVLRRLRSLSPVRWWGPGRADRLWVVPLASTSSWGGAGAGGRWESVAARTLRTAQWTRASLFVKLVRAHGGCLGTRSR
jgi:hypothetical protein